MPLFHLAIPVKDLDESERFYAEAFGCVTGRKNENSVVLRFFGHQLVLHLDRGADRSPVRLHNKVDRAHVPVPHFGMALARDAWESLRQRLEKRGTEFAVPPQVRYAGTSGEQATMFFFDPSGNALEFKSFIDDESAFAPWEDGERKTA
jgi:extradiol dioxygenase family protein